MPCFTASKLFAVLGGAPATIPASTGSSVPVTYDDLSLAKKSTASAMSSVVP